MSQFTDRLGNMVLDALQTFFSTVWGMVYAALTGGIPALAAVVNNQIHYGKPYWQDVIPTFITGALVGIAGFLNQQKALRTMPPEPKP